MKIGCEAAHASIATAAPDTFTNEQPECSLGVTPQASTPFGLVIASATYQAIYDAAGIRFPAWPIASVGLLVAALGVGLGAYLRQRAVTSTVARTMVTSAIIFGVSWALLVGGGLYAQHGQLRAALDDGSAVRIDGVVYDSPPGALRVGGDRSWVVESGTTAHWYRYDSSPLAVGYRRTAPGTGGLRDGLRVRIADVGGRIARIEVERE